MQSNNPTRLYRSQKSRVIAGVCGGLGEYLNIDPIWMRLLFFISLFFGGVGFIIYLVMWIIVPSAPTGTEIIVDAQHKLYRSHRNRMIGGVCGGLGEYFGVDPTWVRLLFVLSVIFLGFGFLLYLLLWIIMPMDPR